MADEQIVEEKKASTGIATVIFAAVIAIALIAFIAQNRSDAKVNWLFLDGDWPLWIVITVSAVAGAVIVEVLSWVLRRRRRSGD